MEFYLFCCEGNKFGTDFAVLVKTSKFVIRIKLLANL